MLLIKQYRHPVRTREWEIPAGLLDVDGEDPLAAAQRELAEEADLVAAEWAVLADFVTSPGGSDEAIRIYLARGLSATPEAFAREDEEADMELRWVPLDECVDAVLARRVQNPSLADRRARRARVAGSRLEHARRRRCPVAGGTPERVDARESRRGDDGRRVDHGYLRHLTIERGLSRNTIAVLPARPRRLRRLARGARHRRPGSVREQDLADFVRHLGARAPAAARHGSIARMLSSVRGLHRFLPRRASSTADVARELRPPKLADAPAEGDHDRADVEALLAATDGDELHELRDTALLELLYATGARVSEAVSLNVDDLVDERRRAAVRQGRQAAHRAGRQLRARGDRRLPGAGAPGAVGAGHAPRRRCSSGCAGSGCRGRTRGSSSVRAAERAELAASRSRRTPCGTRSRPTCSQGGADVRVVQELLGHSSVATTQIYTLVTADTLRDMYTAAHPRAR